jgi:LmbE family N-acetylglucosaminyl deacetylase
MKHVYLSPHLDDAVMSCGGIIHQQTSNGEQVQVITIFAGEYQDGAPSLFALVQHGYWGNPPRPMPLRRAEDTAALMLLGADAWHLDYLDAVYRAGPDGEWLYAHEEALWQKVSPVDPLAEAGIQGLVDRLAALIPPSDQALVYAPLGVGQHVDHQLIHTAARRLLTRGYRVAFYEDYPYAMKTGATQLAVTAAGAEKWQVDTIPLVPADLVAKVSALNYYRSQMYVLFGGIEDMPNRVWAFAASRSPGTGLAERLWRPPEA